MDKPDYIDGSIRGELDENAQSVLTNMLKEDALFGAELRLTQCVAKSLADIREKQHQIEMWNRSLESDSHRIHRFTPWIAGLAVAASVCLGVFLFSPTRPTPMVNDEELYYRSITDEYIQELIDHQEYEKALEIICGELETYKELTKEEKRAQKERASDLKKKKKTVQKAIKRQKKQGNTP